MEVVRRKVQSLQAGEISEDLSLCLEGQSCDVRPVIWENPGQDGVLTAQNAV